ncbi:unnamed protein product, partial [Porites evermanni]
FDSFCQSVFGKSSVCTSGLIKDAVEVDEIPETPSNGLFTLPPPSFHLTSTPVTANSRLHSSLQVEPYRSSAVKLAIFYQSKTVNKC